MEKFVPGFNGMYKVTSSGEIFRRCAEGWKKMGLSRTPKGYLTVSLYKGGVGKKIGVHRIVAKVFIPNPEGKKQVNHIDYNKTNNHKDNLEWVSNQENCEHGLGKNVIQYDLNMNKIREFPSLSKAAKTIKSQSFTYNLTRISQACKGKLESFRGYKWRFTKKG